jgi:hypothetical protein
MSIHEAFHKLHHCMFNQKLCFSPMGTMQLGRLKLIKENLRVKDKFIYIFNK